MKYTIDLNKKFDINIFEKMKGKGQKIRQSADSDAQISDVNLSFTEALENEHISGESP